jgi:hypothetical protein
MNGCVSYYQGYGAGMDVFGLRKSVARACTS